MNTIKTARHLIETHPQEPAAQILARLVLALETGGSLKLDELYSLSPEHFDLAIELLRDWRLDRFYMSKARLFDVSWQLREFLEVGSP
ncbi:MAG: hypothetical protein V4669_07800 [Pseudomonadota bacterium]